MKYILFLAMIAGISACSTATSSTTQGVRAPASVGEQHQEKLWGKKVSHNEEDFLKDVENTPAQHY